METDKHEVEPDFGVREIPAEENPPAEEEPLPSEETRPLFPHRPWMTGIVLVLAMLSIMAGLRDPIWFWLGLPFVLVLALTIYVRLRQHFQRPPEE